MYQRTKPILNLDLPADALERIVYLDSVQAAVDHELDAAYQEAYFDARTTGRFADALRIGRASRKAALRWTRRQNEATGRTVRWSDGYV